MVAHLFYDEKSFQLSDETDVQHLAEGIRLALKPEQSAPWVEFETSDGVTHSILVTPGVPIRFEEYDSTGPSIF